MNILYASFPSRVWRRPTYLRPPAAIALALVLVLPAAIRAQEGGPPEALVRVGEAQQHEVRERRLIVGQVEPGRRSVIAAEEPGRITQAPPDEGAAIDKSDVLARVDTRLLELDVEAAQSAVQEAEARVAEATAQLNLSTRDRDRLERLVSSNVAREKELEDADDRQASDQARLAAAEAGVYRSRSELAQLEERIEKSRVTAPFNAYVVRRRTEVGQWVAAGDPIAEIVELDTVKIRLNVPESMIEQIPRDEPLPLQVEALGSTVEAELFSIVPDGDPQSRTFTAMIHVANEDGRLKPGMSVRAHLPTSASMQAMTVPRDAVQTTPAGRVVYVNRDGVAASLPVRVQFGTGDRFVVAADGLEHGDQVVVQGNERLAPGQPLRIAEDDVPEDRPTAEPSDDAPAERAEADDEPTDL